MPPPKPLNALRRLPPEIRAIIFDYVLGIRRPSNTLWLGRIPGIPPATPAAPAVPAAPATPAAPGAPNAPNIPVVPATQPQTRPAKPKVSALFPTPGILAALRASSTPDLYGEALEVFYANNNFTLDITSFRSFSGLRVETVQVRHFFVLFLGGGFRMFEPIKTPSILHIHLSKHSEGKLIHVVGQAPFD
jgi:hypothetical protein